MVPLLENRPEKAHEVVARLTVRGKPGAPAEYARDELRWKADGVGADAVVKTAQYSRWDGTPAPSAPRDPLPRLSAAHTGGNA
jgi:hypothetical protein